MEHSSVQLQGNPIEFIETISRSFQVFIHLDFRIQIFHCHEASSCGGGETLLLDGFALAKTFKENYPEGYDFFSKNPIESEYIHVQSEPKAHYFSKDLVFKHCPFR